MPSNNGKNENNTNASDYNARAAARKQKRTEKLKAKQLKNNKVYRPANSGKFEHLRKVVAEFNKNTAAYIRYKNRKLAEEMAKQNNEQKPENAPKQVNQTNPETEIKNENNVIIEEPVIKEEPQKPIEEVVNENGVEMMGLEDIKVDDAELDDPELDKELAQLEQKIKEEEELKAQGIDPDTVEEPDDPEFAKEVRELMQENEEKLEGAALEEAFQSLSNEIEGENKDSEADENDDPYLDEELNRLAQEIKNEEAAAKTEENEPEVAAQTNQTEADDIIVEDVKEETEKIQPVETNEIKLLGEEKVDVPVENSQPKAESTVLQSNNVNNPLSTSHLSEESVARSRFSDALKRNDPRHRTVRTPFNEQRELSRRDVIIEAVTEDETDFEIDYDINETVSDLNETESVNTHQINMPEYSNLLKARSEDKNITARATSITANILKAAGAKLPEESTLATDTYNKLFATIKDAGTEATMHDLAVKTFEDSYDMLRGIDLKPREHVVAAQNIANMMLYTYSPIAFMNGELTQYAESYVAMNESLLRQQLEKNGFANEELDLLASNVRDAVTGEPEPEPEPKVNGQSYFLKFSKQLENKGLKEQVEKQLAVILNESGLKNGVDAGEIAKGILETNLGTIDSSYNPDLVPLNPQTSILAKTFYSEAYKGIYDVTLEENDKIMTAQKITDVILKNYSPAAFDKEKFGKYANNFIVGNKDNLKECLTDAEAPEEEIEAAMQRDMKSELRWAYFKNAMRNLDQQDAENEAEIEDIPEIKEQVPEIKEQVPVINEQEVEMSAPIMNEQIENNATVEIKPDEITEIKVEKQSEPTLADDFESMKSNSNEPNPEQIKIVENLPENIEGKQVNTETTNLDTHAFFQTIENNLTKPKTEENVVVAPQPEEKPKPTYSVPPIPGMSSPLKQENTNNAPKLTEEERKAKELADAKAALERLQNIHTGTFEERRDRAKMISYYQGIVDKHKSSDELFKESLELSEKARREAKEREDREKQLKELENSVKNNIVEDRNNENESLEIKSEAEAVPSLRIADFYDKLGERMGDQKIATQVRSEMTEIIKEAGITDQEKATDIAEYSYFDIKDTINSIYDSTTVTETQMSTDAPIFFYNAFLSLGKADLNTKDRIITAQKIADVMIKNYSPVAFVEKELDRFADNYVLKDAELLGVQLHNLGFKNQDVHKLTNEFFGVPENEHTQPEIEPAPGQPAPEQQPEPPKPELPEQEPPKQNAAPAQNLGPEWISMPEFDQKLERLDKITALPGNAKREISSILKESGIETGGDDPLEFAEIIKDAYDPKKLSRDVPQSMRDITKSVFVSTYNALSKKGFTPENKIETTQRVADVLLKLYSPASLSGVKELQKYTQNYVIGDKQLLRECLTSLNVPQNEINTIIGEPKPEVKPEAKTEVKPEAKTEPKPEAKPEVKPEAKTEAKPEVKPEAKTEAKPEAKPEAKTISNDARVAVFTEKLKTYNNMYKLNIDSNNFASSVTDAWTLMTSGDKQKAADGQKVMNDLFKDTLKAAFNIEKGAAYEEHRLPEYAEIIKSTNELLRSSMYAITDMYHNQNRKNLFDATAFGGLDAKDMSELIVGESLWDKDQKSDEAWEIQSKEAKNIADKWLKENKPYEKMISEMKALVNANKDNIVSRKEVLDKLTAAEWLLINNEKMMIEDPEDPLNPIPNWGNRYWKALTETREALGIDKHTSMRDLIQGDYAAMAKPASNANYNQTQIQLYVLDEDVRELCDSMEVQKEQFATMSATVTLTKPTNENKQLEKEMTENRVQYTVHELDQREIMKNEPKVFSNMVIERTNELTIESKAGQI